MNKSIKTTLMVTLAATALSVSGQVFDFPIDPAHSNTPQTIPDASDGNTYLGTVSGANTFPNGYYIKVSLDIEGDPIAKNGDYYATLTDVATGNKAVLLNRVGKGSPDFPNGYADNGMRVTLVDNLMPIPTSDIHTYRTGLGLTPDVYLSPLTGTFAPDARSADPTKVTWDRNDFVNQPLKSLINISAGKTDPNGVYALFIQDTQPGGIGKLVDWSLEFVAVPEPQTYALVIGLGLIGFGLYRRFTA